MRLKLSLVCAATATALILLGAAPPAAADSPSSHSEQRVKVIASGLDNPRGLVVAHDNLYIAQSGKGGSGPCLASPEGGASCLGSTGKISVLNVDADGRRQCRAIRDLVTGLPSLGAQGTGDSAVGPSDVAVDRDGQVWATVGLGGNPTLRSGALGNTALSRRLATVGVVQGGRYLVQADLGAFEQTKNPDGNTPPDTNPQALVSTRDGLLVTDAGGNDLLSVKDTGNVRSLFVFPNKPAVPNPLDPKAPPISPQSVPDSIVRGPDGAFYIGELTGFPFVPGTAAVWRWLPGHTPTVYASGFTNIIDLGFTKKGDLLVLEIAKDGLSSPNGPIGALIQVSRKSGKQSTVPTGPLFAPGGLAVDGSNVYVSNNSILAGQGQILRVHLDS